jgi:hypothetical protein
MFQLVLGAQQVRLVQMVAILGLMEHLMQFLQQQPKAH